MGIIRLNKIATALLIIHMVFAACGIELGTNQMMIGDEVVDTKLVDGKLMGERWLSVSNELIRVRFELQLPETPSASEKKPLSINALEPCMRLLFED
jgi:hypothetical protein